MSLSTIVVAANAMLLRNLALRPQDHSRPAPPKVTRVEQHQHPGPH